MTKEGGRVATLFVVYAQDALVGVIKVALFGSALRGMRLLFKYLIDQENEEHYETLLLEDRMQNLVIKVNDAELSFGVPVIPSALSHRSIDSYDYLTGAN